LDKLQWPEEGPGLHVWAEYCPQIIILIPEPVQRESEYAEAGAMISYTSFYIKWYRFFLPLPIPF
jgi:hypothetical protein